MGGGRLGVFKIIHETQSIRKGIAIKDMAKYDAAMRHTGRD